MLHQAGDPKLDYGVSVEFAVSKPDMGYLDSRVLYAGSLHFSPVAYLLIIEFAKTMTARIGGMADASR